MNRPQVRVVSKDGVCFMRLPDKHIIMTLKVRVSGFYICTVVKPVHFKFFTSSKDVEETEVRIPNVHSYVRGNEMLHLEFFTRVNEELKPYLPGGEKEVR